MGRHVVVHAGWLLANGLLAGRGRRAADQPDPLQPVLPGEARVLSRKPCRLSDRPARKRQRESAPRPGAVLQPAHRSFVRWATHSGHWRRPADGSIRAAGCRAAEHADRRFRGASGRQLHCRAGVARSLEDRRAWRFLLRARSGGRTRLQSGRRIRRPTATASRRWRSKGTRCAARPRRPTGDWAGRAGLRLDTRRHRARAGIAPHRRRLPPRPGFRPAARHGHASSAGMLASSDHETPQAACAEYSVGADLESTTNDATRACSRAWASSITRCFSPTAAS